jgi:uncharacterized membrane protein
MSETNSDIHGEDKLICAGLLGLSIAGVFHFADGSHASALATASVVFFSIAVPFLAASTLIMSSHAQKAGAGYYPWFRLPLLVLGFVSAFLGFDLLFWSFASLTGALFTFLSLCGLIFWAFFRAGLRRRPKDT